MEGMDESITDLKDKLAEYQQQLDVVDNALITQPEEEALRKLHADLTEVISLTRDLISYQAKSEPSQPKIEIEKEKPKKQSLVGRTCEAEYEGAKYLGEIIDIINDTKAKEQKIRVKFLVYENVEDYRAGKIKIYQPPHPSLLSPGTKAQAVNVLVGQWQSCVVGDRNSDGSYTVIFSKNKNAQITVKFDQVRLVSTHIKDSQRQQISDEKKKNVNNKDSNSKDRIKKVIKEIITPGGYKIPEFLAVKSTDTEAVKNSKRRKVQLLKKQQKQDQQEIEAKTRATTWRNFTHKVTQKKVKGFLSGRNRESIFKSSDSTKQAIAPLPINPIPGFIPRRKHDKLDEDEQ